MICEGPPAGAFCIPRRCPVPNLCRTLRHSNQHCDYIQPNLYLRAKREFFGDRCRQCAKQRFQRRAVARPLGDASSREKTDTPWAGDGSLIAAHNTCRGYYMGCYGQTCYGLRAIRTNDKNILTFKPPPLRDYRDRTHPYTTQPHRRDGTAPRPHLPWLHRIACPDKTATHSGGHCAQGGGTHHNDDCRSRGATF